MLAAKILWLCRSNGVPVYLEEILDAFSVTIRQLRQVLTEVEYIPPLKVSDYISRVAKLLTLSPDLSSDAKTIANQINIIDGSSPRVIAGYSIIKAASANRKSVKTHEVAKALMISTVALRKCYLRYM